MASTPHPLIEAAARGDLPSWAEVRPARRAHVERVAALLNEWARIRREEPQQRLRWVAAGYLHDALRDAEPEALRSLVPPSFAGLPGKVLHGPAAAARLRGDGVEDEELLHALTYHTLGSREFELLGWALFSADFLEPGRTQRKAWRKDLRKRAPGDLPGVVREILAARLQYLAERRRPMHPSTVAFWNRMVGGQEWAGASEV